MSYSNVIDDIQKLPHYREYTCKKCGHKQKVFVLLIQSNCKECGTRNKLRGYASIGSEVEDVIDTVLIWIGKDADLAETMNWKKILDDSEN